MNPLKLLDHFGICEATASGDMKKKPRFVCAVIFFDDYYAAIFSFMLYVFVL